MNDLEDIKKRIFEEDRIGDLLIKLECQNVRLKANRYEAQLPNSFNSSNSRSVQVFLSETLYCAVRSRGITNIDIYDLVSYILFECDDKDSFRKNLYKSKKWICQQLGYEEFLGHNNTIEMTENPLGWLKKIKNQRLPNLKEFEENQIYDDSILLQFNMCPVYKFYQDGVNYETQSEYQVGFDVRSERIIFPIYNQYGEIISVKGRTTDPNYKEKDVPKFIYYYPYNKSIEWYNWHLALYDILEKNEVIIFEAEKSCWLAAQYGYRNTLAIGGTDISLHQIEILKKLPFDTKIILAYDKDKTQKDILREARKFGIVRPIYTFWDSGNLLDIETKDSPVDKGKEIFEVLYDDSKKRKMNELLMKQ